MSTSRELKAIQEIHECSSFREVLKHCTYNSTIAIDIDNTILRPTKVDDLGSDQWFRKVVQKKFAETPEGIDVVKRAIKLHQNLQMHIQVKAVEPDMPKIMKILQDVKLTTIIVTARRYDIADLTLKQLSDASVDLYRHANDENVTFKIQGKQVSYVNGVLFCDGANKGLCLTELLKHQRIACDNVVMLDDSPENLQNAREVLKAKGYGFCGLRYNRLDERVSRFDLQRANAKLSAFSLFFSKSVTNIVKEFGLENPQPAQNSCPELREISQLRSSRS